MSTQRIDSSAPHVSLVLERANYAISGARQTRRDHQHRRREDRFVELVQAIAIINDSMKEVRPLVHAAARHDVPGADLLREASDHLQRERRKLRKMLGRTTGGITSLDGGWS